MTRKILIWTLAAISATFTLLSCNPTPKEILEQELAAVMKKHQAIGLAVVAVEQGKIVYNESFGYKDLANQTPLADGDLFRIASISKSFTATAIMQLIEQGKIDLEGDVSSYLGFPVRNPEYPDKPLTIRMLLSHSSSLNDSEGYFNLNVINPDSSATWKQAYNHYEPGTKYEYCNLGYNTLGTILEKVSGERFDQYIVNHILTPAGVYGGYHVASLDSTRFVKIYEYQPDGTFRHSPDAYAKRTKEIENYKFGYSTPIFSPTGGLKISARDLAQIMIMHINLGKIAKEGGDSIRIIDRHSAELMQTRIISPTDEGDAYGFAIRTTDQLLPGHTMIGHTGGAYGVYTSMFWDSQRKFGFIVMTNGCNGQRDNNFMSIHRDATAALYKYISNN